MPGQADGSIIIDTELNSGGFKAGSTELLAAIKSLSEEVKNLGATLKEIFNKSLTPEVNTSGAEEKVAALEAQVQELETAMENLQNTGNTGETAVPEVNLDSTTQKASDLQRQIEAVNSSVERLEPIFQKAMSGSESAMATFEDKASVLEEKIGELQERLDAVANTQYPTQEYEEVTKQIEKAEQALLRLYDKRDKMSETGVKENSKQWQNLQYDIQIAEEALNRFEATKARMESSGSAFTIGVDTSQYAQMEATLAQASSRLEEMQSGTNRSEGFMRRLASAAGDVASYVGKAAKSAAGALVFGIKSAVSHMAKLLTHSKAMKGQFNGLISGAKKFALSLLGARGIYALLRKAVSAYMAENQELSNTLSACWAGIGNLLGPIITKLINLVAQAVAYVTSFLKLFGVFGSSASKAISNAGAAASDAAKDLKRQLASFDELNVLSASSSDSSGGDSGDVSTELPDVTLPDWAKLMVEQIKVGDWTGAAATLANQLNKMVTSVDWSGIGQKVGYYLNDALTFLATSITSFDWRNLGVSFGELINSIIYGVDWANLGIVLGWKFIALIEGLGGLFATLDWESLGKALGDAFMGLWNVIDWAQAAKTLSDGIIGALNSLSSAIKTVDWVKLGNDIATFVANVDYGGVATALFDALGAALGGISAFLWGLLEDAFSGIGNYFGTYIEEAEACGGSWVEGLLLGIWDAIKNIGVWIYEHVFQPLIQGFKDAFGINSPSTVMAEMGGYIIEGLLQGISNGWHSIVEFFTDALAGIGNSINKAWNNIKSRTSTAWSSVKSTLTNTWKSIKSTASTTWSSLKSTISTKWSEMKSNASSAWSSIKSSLSSTWNSIKSTASSTFSNIKSAIQNQGWSGVGSNICTGISNGISSGWSWLKNTVSDLAGSLLSAAKNVLGIHSPSRLFRDQVGKYIGLGIGEGVEDSEPSIIKSVSGVADAIADEFATNSYTISPINVDGNSAIPRALDSFSDRITDSFTSMLDQLRTIAERVTFAAPVVASGAIPYSLNSSDVASSNLISNAIEASNDELSSVVIQSVTNATAAIVRAIQEYSGTTVNLDIDSITSGVISEINRKTRMTGKNPLLI